MQKRKRTSLYYPEDNQQLNVFMNNPMSPERRIKKRNNLHISDTKVFDKTLQPDALQTQLAYSHLPNELIPKPNFNVQITSNDKRVEKLDQSMEKSLEKIRNRKVMIRSVPRLIYPAIAIVHRHAQLVFYQCSLCSYTAQRLRKTWFFHQCQIEMSSVQYVWDLGQKSLSFTPNQLPDSIEFCSLLKKLKYKNTLEAIKLEDIDEKLKNYPKWLKQFSELRNNPKQAKIKVQAQQWVDKGNQIASNLQTTNKKLSSSIKTYLSLQQSLESTNYRNQELEKQKNQIVDEIWEKFMPIVQTFTKGQIKRVLANTTHIDQITKKTILTSLITQQQQITIQNAILGFHSSLNDYVEKKTFQIKKRFNDYQMKLPRTIRQIRRQTNASKFLKSIPETIIVNKRLMIQKLKMAPSKNIQIASISMLNQLIKSTGIQIPEISRFIVQKTAKKQKIRVSIEQIRNIVLNILNSSQFQKVLAVDLWFAFCLGLRLNDLSRIHIRISSEEFYDYIGLIEQKNSHNALRVVPTSLKKLVYWYDVSYPISKKRIQSLISFCKSKFGGFYILRHACLTNTLARLMQQTGFRPHQSSSTTLKYYVDYTNYDFVDKAFSLTILNSFSEFVTKRSYLVGRFGTINDDVIRQKVQQTQQTEILLPSTINDMKASAEQLSTIAALNNSKVQSLIQIAPIPLTSKQGLASILFDAEGLNIFMSVFNFTYCSYFQLLSSITKTKILIVTSNCCVVFNPEGKVNYQQKCLQKLNEQIQKQDSVDYREQFQSKNTSQFSCDPEFKEGDKHFAEDKEIFVVSEDEQDFQNHSLKFQPSILLQKDSFVNNQTKLKQNIHEKQILKIQQELIKTGKRTTLQENCQVVILAGQKNQKPIYSIIKKPQKSLVIKQQIEKKESIRIAQAAQQKAKILVKRQAYCRNCRQILETRLTISDSRCRTYCDCEVEQQFDIEIETLKKRYKVWNIFFNAEICILNSEFGIFDTDDIKSPPFEKLSIGSPNFVQQHLKLTNRKHLKSMCSSSSIKSLLLPWETVTKKMSKIINQVRVFQNRLPLKIMQCRNKSKGLGVFATKDLAPNTVIGTYLGIIRPSSQILEKDDSLVSIGWLQRQQLFICCKQAANIGRYFNSSKKPNMVLKLVLLQKNLFCPYFITIKKIYRDQQLLWNYGKSYWER